MIISVSAEKRRELWCQAVRLGLPQNFDLRNIRTGDDATHFIIALPNNQRGIAAKLLYDHRYLVGNNVAFCGLMQAWQHDHLHVLIAFGSHVALAAAIRELNPAPRGKRPIIAWRGADSIDGAIGLSWTSNRDVACFFAFRSKNTPCVFRCELNPDDIVARYNGRHEHELIVDPARIDLGRVTMEYGERGFDTYAGDITSHQDVPRAAIAHWKAGAERYSDFINARNKLRLEKCRQPENRNPPVTAGRKPRKETTKRRISKSAIRYCGAGLPRKPTSAGRFLVHNHVVARSKLGMGGFRAWVQEGRSGLVRCRCDFGGCKNAELHKHYRVRALPPPLPKESAAKKRSGGIGR